MRCTASDGVRCAAQVTGTAATTLLFVHGAGSTAAIWDPQFGALGGRFRCAAVELRGNGVAPLPIKLSSISREGFARDCLAVADALSVERFHLVGCSLGGVVGLELWRMAPRRLASLTLLDSFACYPDGEAVAERIVGAVLEAPSLIAFAEERSSYLLPPGARSHRRTETVQQMARKDRRAYARSIVAAWTGDYRAMLPEIVVPALVLWGQHDIVTPWPLSQELAAAIPGAHLLEVPDAGHVSNADAPEFVNAALEAFVAAVANGAR
ncbi:MAG: alpha/beta fold hydrolase [bacterium]|nr:alpha/beta fold hydrolase [bacterium]